MGIHKVILNRVKETAPQRLILPENHWTRDKPIERAALQAEWDKKYKAELRKWKRKYKRIEEALQRCPEKDLKLIMEYL